MVQNIFIIGATGKVGSTLVRQILENNDGDFKIHQNPTRIIGLSSSKSYILNEKGLSKKDCEDFSKRKIEGKKYKELIDLLVNVKKEGFGYEKKILFIDVTASNDMLAFHKKVLSNPKMGIVTANKNPLTFCDFETFNNITKDFSSYGYRCSVMAGAEAVNILQDLRDVNDAPTEVFGCFSGTLGYISTELQKERKLSEIIKKAKELGYTEPHPRDDLNGLDVARKLLTLARTAGYNVNIDDVKVTPFIPKNYLENDDVNDFIEKTKELDDIFKEKVTQAKSKGNVLRYVARLMKTSDKINLNVSLEEVPKESSLGILKGTSNKITVISKIYSKEKPYVVEAPGAGLEITAQNIRRDLLYRLQKRIN